MKRQYRVKQLTEHTHAKTTHWFYPQRRTRRLWGWGFWHTAREPIQRTSASLFSIGMGYAGSNMRDVCFDTLAKAEAYIECVMRPEDADEPYTTVTFHEGGAK